MKVNKNIWTGKNKPYNRNSLYYPDGINSGGGTPTPPSGGESTMEYWDISANASAIEEISLFFLLLKSRSEYGISVLSTWNLSTHNIQRLAVALDRNLEVILEGESMTVGDFLNASGIADFSMFGWNQITKEQFYSLD